MELKTLLVDDEKMARDTLRGLLEHCCPEVAIVGEAGSVKEGMRKALELKPDLVFLDIQMQDGTGFDLLGMFPRLEFGVIFTTAYDQYAIRAIEFSAQGYLLKPIGMQELRKAVDRFLKDRPGPEVQSELGSFFRDRDSPSRIVIPTQEGMHFLDLSDIIRCEGENSYTTFHLTSGRLVTVAKSLKKYEELLEPVGFFRVGISHLVNLSQVALLRRGRGGSLEMKDGSEIPVSRNRRKELLQALDRYLKG